MSDKRTSNVVLASAVLLLVPLLYLGSYLALLDDNGPKSLAHVGSQLYFAPTFKVGGVAAQYVYWPAYMLDRALRPVRWRLDFRDPSAVQKEMWFPSLGW